MIWVTWRQHRRELLVLALVLGAIAAYLIHYGLAEYAAYYHVANGISVATCQQQHRQDALCDALSTDFYDTYSNDLVSLIALILLPVLVGMFLGAPLVARELEHGTHRLVWTQSVTRLRWLLVKVGAQVGATLLLFAALSLIVRWWIGPFNLTNGPFGQYYDITGIVPLAYLAYALALAIAAGAFLRRTVPAMFATLVGYLAVRIPIGVWARPQFVPPLSVTWDPYIVLPKSNPGNQDWTLYFGFVDQSGQHVSPPQVYNTCSPAGTPPVDYTPGSSFTACTHAHGWIETAIWQPADRYWLFQGIESAIFLGLAAVLLGLAIWWVRRRLA